MAEEKISPITRIRPVDSPDEIYELGSLFKNVYLGADEQNNNTLINYTLLDLYKELKSYFSDNDFIWYSDETPEASQVKVWFDTSTPNEDSSEEEAG